MLIPVSDSALLWFGRWGSKTIAGIPSKISIGGGSAIRFRFSGTSISLICRASTEAQQPLIAWRIDGGAWTVAAQAASMTLNSGLAAGLHTAEIVVDATYYATTSVSWVTHDAVTIQGIGLDNGAALSSWGVSGRNVLCYGDSITEGLKSFSNAEGVATGSARQSWGFFLSVSANFDPHVVGYGGGGCTKAGRRLVPSFPSSWPYAGDGIPTDEPNYAVIINFVGHNDGAADDNTFRTAFRSLLDLQHASHPKARIYCIGPLSLATQHRANVQAVCAEAAYSTFAEYVDPAGWVGITYTDGVHPTVSGHAVIASYLSPLVAEYLATLVTTVTITEPTTPTATDTQLVSGTVTGDGAAVTVNGVPADLVGSAWSLTVALTPGINSITAIATNIAGSASATVAIEYIVPEVPDTPRQQIMVVTPTNVEDVQVGLWNGAALVPVRLGRWTGTGFEEF